MLLKGKGLKSFFGFTDVAIGAKRGIVFHFRKGDRDTHARNLSFHPLDV
jgi:hypothetical protein